MSGLDNKEDLVKNNTSSYEQFLDSDEKSFVEGVREGKKIAIYLESEKDISPAKFLLSQVINSLIKVGVREFNEIDFSQIIVIVFEKSNKMFGELDSENRLVFPYYGIAQYPLYLQEFNSLVKG